MAAKVKLLETTKMVRSNGYDTKHYKPGSMASVIREFTDTLGRKLYRVTMLDDGFEMVLLETDVTEVDNG